MSTRKLAVASTIAMVALGLFVALQSSGFTLAQLPEVSAQPPPTHTHLRVWSYVPHGGHDDKVINNSIKITVTAEADRSPAPDQQDVGTLTLTPGDPSTFSWVCPPATCPNGFFADVDACDQAGGCSESDVLEWLVGFELQAGGAPQPLKLPDRVHYAIDSDDLGDGERYHASPADCDTTVTPVDETYGATDLQAGYDYATLCSDNGATIALEYE